MHDPIQAGMRLGAAAVDDEFGFSSALVGVALELHVML